MSWTRIDWQEALLIRWIATCPPEERAELAAGAAQWAQENRRGVVSQPRMRGGAEVDAQEGGRLLTPPQSSGVRARVRSRRAWMRWQRRGADGARPLRSVLRQALG